MTNEHEKLPSGKLAEAIDTYDTTQVVTYPADHPYALVIAAARKFAALEPLLRGEPTREMWAAMGDAIVKDLPGLNLHHDKVAAVVYGALHGYFAARIRGIVDGKA